MPVSSILLAQDVEHDLPVPAQVIGLVIFIVLCALMAALLMFGKGRPHA
jgi:hypothetical protein